MTIINIEFRCRITELHEPFRDFFYREVDFENALSFFFVFKAPDRGGELLLYNRDWEQRKLVMNENPYELRHDMNGTILNEQGKENVQHISITPATGDLLIFRAAQIWHAVNPPQGTNCRITAGGFFSRSLTNGTLRYWS